MSDSTVVSLAAQALVLTAKIAGPVLVVSLVIGLAVSVLQSATQIQEYTLSFVPKLLGVAVVLLVSGHWMIGQMVAFTDQLMANVPRLLAGG